MADAIQKRENVFFSKKGTGCGRISLPQVVLYLRAHTEATLTPSRALTSSGIFVHFFGAEEDEAWGPGGRRSFSDRRGVCLLSWSRGKKVGGREVWKWPGGWQGASREATKPNPGEGDGDRRNRADVESFEGNASGARWLVRDGRRAEAA